MTRALGFILWLVFIVVSVQAQQAAPLVFREETHDFGTIEEERGPVVHDFVFMNASPRPVKILKVQASCGCTTPAWSRDVVAPGKEGFIQARFDPKGRPGFFTKTLTVTTDIDPNPVVLQIKGHVSSESKPSATDYPSANGSLKMHTSSFNLGRVFLRDEYVTRDFPVVNGGDTTLHFTGDFTHPTYIRVDAQPRTLLPGQKGVIRVSYNGGLKNQYGFQSDNVEIGTDDKVNPVKSFSVYATLEDYFPSMTPAELSAAPRLTFAASTVDVGQVARNATISKEISFVNTGKKVLEIKAVQPNCSCVTAILSRRTFKPGESGTVTINFDPAERRGTQNKAVTFYSNDPKKPVQRVTFTAYVQ